MDTQSAVCDNVGSRDADRDDVVVLLHCWGWWAARWSPSEGVVLTIESPSSLPRLAGSSCLFIHEFIN
jgi:hypothetical protein